MGDDKPKKRLIAASSDEDEEAGLPLVSFLELAQPLEDCTALVRICVDPSRFWYRTGKASESGILRICTRQQWSRVK